VASDQAIRDLEPLARRVADAAHRKMPASADLDAFREFLDQINPEDFKG
jgi:hypothetical protein